MAGKSLQFSLWATPAPDSPLRTRLASVISELSAKYGTPPFDPHVTVLGGFGEPQRLSEEEVFSRSRALCKALKPYTCRVKELSAGSAYFQCVYLLMEKTDEVMQPYTQACAAFGAGSKDYMPHLSLIYGNLATEQKEEAKQFVTAGSNDLLRDTEFMVSSLQLWRTEGGDKLMTTWEKLADIPLEG